MMQIIFICKTQLFAWCRLASRHAQPGRACCCCRHCIMRHHANNWVLAMKIICMVPPYCILWSKTQLKATWIIVVSLLFVRLLFLQLLFVRLLFVRLLFVRLLFEDGTYSLFKLCGPYLCGFYLCSYYMKAASIWGWHILKCRYFICDYVYV